MMMMMVDNREMNDCEKRSQYMMMMTDNREI